MEYKIIKEIISMNNISEKEKLNMIEEIAHRFELIDKYAKEKSSKEGRDLTFEDEYQASLRVASEFNVSLDKKKHNLLNNIETGIKYIIEQQTESGGWGRTQRDRLPKRLRKYVKSDRFSPLPSSWCTGMAITTLNLAYRFLKRNSSIEEAIKKGLSWIKNNQDDSGGWRDVDLTEVSGSGNKIHLIQTGMAVCALFSGMRYFHRVDLKNYFDKGLNFLEKSQNKSSGGWPSLLSNLPDAKATSISIIACLLGEKNDCARNGVEWLINHQKPGGDWGYRRTSDSFLYGVYYGIATLQMFRLFSNRNLKSDTKFSFKLNKAIRKALFWYEQANELIKSENDYHWAWKGGDRIADIANTACALIVLLDYSELDFQFLIDRAIEYLIKEKDCESMWEGDTSLVVYSLIKYCYPDSRLENSFDIFEKKLL